MKLEHPNKKVALVTFGSTVYLWGDCHDDSVKSFTGDILNKYDDLIAAGREYASSMELSGLESTHRYKHLKVVLINFMKELNWRIMFFFCYVRVKTGRFWKGICCFTLSVSHNNVNEQTYMYNNVHVVVYIFVGTYDFKL